MLSARRLVTTLLAARALVPAPAPAARRARPAGSCRGGRPSGGAAMSAAPGGAGRTDAGTEVAVVYVTVPDREVGRKLASELLSARLVACVNLIPGVESMYRWEGKVESDDELLLMMKTRSALVDTVAQRVVALHPYDLPEVISAPVVGGLQGYLDWVLSSTTPEGDSPAEGA